MECKKERKEMRIAVFLLVIGIAFSSTGFPLLVSGDSAGPVTSNILAVPNPTSCAMNVTLTAAIDDSTAGNSNIKAAEYFIDNTELYYDDGDWNYAFRNAPGGIGAVKFNVSDYTQVLKLKYYVVGESVDLNVYVLDANLNVLLLKRVTPYPGWFEVDIENDNVFINGDFFAVVQWIPEYQNEDYYYGPFIGVDIDLPHHQRSYVGSVDSIIPALENEDFLIRATVKPISGKGMPMLAQDGIFDSPTENVIAVIDVTGISPGLHTLYVHGQDGAENWGKLDSHELEVSCSLDLSIVNVKPVQVLEDVDFNNDGYTDLVAGKATAVKVVVKSTGATGDVDVHLHFNDGKMNELVTFFYVYELSNFNHITFKFVGNSIHHPLRFSGAEEKTVYFFPSTTFNEAGGPYNFNPPYHIYATVDPSGKIDEINENNNTNAADPFYVYNTLGEGDTYLRIVYVPINEVFLDNSWKNSCTQASSWMNATYPITDDHVRTEFGYPIPMPPTPLSYVSNLIDLYTMAKLSYPFANRVVGVTPAGFIDWSSLRISGPHNYGVSVPGLLSVFVEPYEGRDLRQIVAHEIGHTFGLRLPRSALDSGEEYYDKNDNGTLRCSEGVDETGDECGNYVRSGLWVKERIVKSTNPLGISPCLVRCFMGASVGEGHCQTYWVDLEDYQGLFSNMSPDLSSSRKDIAESSYNGILIVRGLVHSGNTIELNNWYRLPQGVSEQIISEKYSVEMLDGSENLLFSQNFAVHFALTGSDLELDTSGFAFSVPYIEGIKKVLIKHEGAVLAQRIVSDNSPAVGVTSPNGGEIVRGTVRIQWNGTDVDGDDLFYAVLFSADGGKTWNTLGIDLDENYYIWNTSKLEEGDEYMVKVIATDGINTGIDMSDSVFSVRKPIFQSSDYFVDKNKMIKPLASTRISQAESLKEKAHSLLQEAVGKGIDVSQVQTLVEKANESLADAKEQYISCNYIAANTLALEAIDLYQRAIGILEGLLG